MKTRVIISLALALIMTVIISKAMNSPDSLEKLLKKAAITNLNGVALDKSELEGKVVILSFFQTWCSDCAKEQPELTKLQDKFGNKIKILYVSDEPFELIQSFREKFSSELNFYHTDKKLKKDGIAKKFPTTYLIDPKGEVKLVKVEGIHWYTPETIAMIEQMLAQ
jgi:thiol-disulfide isomerase/thioredoxin